MAKRPKRTPLEMAIAKQADRRVVYETKMKDAGLVKITVWASPETAKQIKELARISRESSGNDG